MKSKVKKVTVFMDGVDWVHEIGEAADGNVVYPTIRDLQKYNRCWEGCGVVKCEIKFKEWVIEEDLKQMYKTSSKDYSAEEFEKNYDILRYEAALKRLEALEDLVSKQKHRVIDLKATLNSKEKK